jgi:F-type H+-transporting ATPase subunit epsilon
MAADKIDLEIVTPKGKALSVVVDEVTAPSVEGEFGVLPGHVPLVASLRTGIVTYRQGNESKRVAVGAGFAEAGQNKLVILADEFADRAQIDPVLVRKELAEVQAKLEKLIATAEMTPDLANEKKHLIDRENWCAAQLELHGDPPMATMRPNEEWGPPTPAIVEEEEGKINPPGGSVTGSP